MRYLDTDPLAHETTSIKRTIFKNKIYYWFLVTILGGVLLVNLYLAFISSNLYGLLPILIQGALLTLIFMKHEYAKIGIRIWIIVVLITGSGLLFVGRLLNDMLDGFNNVNFEFLLTAILTIVIGITLLFFANETVVVEEAKKEVSSNYREER